MPVRSRSSRSVKNRHLRRGRRWLPFLFAAAGIALFWWRHDLAAQTALPPNADPLQTTSGPFTYGSAAVLDRCWTPAELAGADTDRLVLPRDPRPDLSPPARTAPLHRRPAPPATWRDSIRSVRPTGERRLLALTFDLCERAHERTGYDAALVRYLREARVPATFFAGGKWLRSHSEQALQLMADPLFEVGNHGWTHANHRVVPPDEGDKQIEWTQAQYELLWEQLRDRPCAREAGEAEMNRIPRIPLLFRFPYGACHARSLAAAAARGLTSVQWSIITGDPAPQRSAAAIAETVLRLAHPGAIVIGHANGRGHHTTEALRLFVPSLRAQGYEFVTVSDLLSLGAPVSAAECYEERPGDNLKYDRLYREGR